MKYCKVCGKMNVDSVECFCQTGEKSFRNEPSWGPKHVAVAIEDEVFDHAEKQIKYNKDLYGKGDESYDIYNEA